MSKEYKIEKQIREMLDKYQKSDFTKKEVRRCISETLAFKLKERFKNTNK
tara:strand:- start:581 stop:730 length:150 start_codon:yes stop_codon:yes gene_type:complete